MRSSPGVSVRGQAAARQIPGGLRDRQRQVPQLICEPVRVLRRQPGHRPCTSPPSARASTSISTGTATSAHRCSREVISTWPPAARQPAQHILRLLGVVEDQQPLALFAQRAQHRPVLTTSGPARDRCSPVPRSRAADLVADQPRPLGRHLTTPGHRRSANRCAYSMTHSVLPTPRPLQRLHHGPVPGRQPLPHRHQRPVPPGEPRIAGKDIDTRGVTPGSKTARPACSKPLACPPWEVPAWPVRAGRYAATASSSTRRACSSASPDRSRAIQRPQQRRHPADRHLLQLHRHQPVTFRPSRWTSVPPTLRSCTATGRIRRREQRHHRSHRSSASLIAVTKLRPAPIHTYPAQPCTRPRPAARPPTPATPGQHPHD